MNIYDRLRLRVVAARYDLALDGRGVGRRRRRELRRELHANLTDAAQDVGARQALGGVGRMAASVTEDDAEPRWTTGLAAAALGLLLVLVVELLAAANYIAGALDGGATRASGTLIPFPASDMVVESGPDRFAVSLGFGWMSVLVPVIAFVLFARPWRLLSRADETIGRVSGLITPPASIRSPARPPRRRWPSAGRRRAPRARRCRRRW